MLEKMKALGDDMDVVGKKLEDEELVEYIQTSLEEDFNSIVSGICARAEPILVGELYSQLIHFESRQELLYENQHQASANAGNRGRGTWRDRGGPMRGRDPSRGGSSSHRGGAPGHNSRGYSHGKGTGYNNRTTHSDIPCQVCYKKNHTAAVLTHI
jgi:hypothetical protein